MDVGQAHLLLGQRDAIQAQAAPPRICVDDDVPHQ